MWTALLGRFRLTDRLALRLAALLTVALLPLGLLTVLTSLDSRRTDVRSTERAVLSLTADTEAGRRALVESAFTTARTLARPTMERLDDPEACRALLADTVRRAGVFSFVGFTEADGWMRCASAGDPQDFSDSAIFRASMDDPRAVVRRSEAGAVTGRPVLIASHPVFQDGMLRGFLSVVIEQQSIAWLIPAASRDADVRPVLFNRLGDVLSVEDGGAAPSGILPRDVDLATLAAGAPKVFEGRTRDGERAVFAVAALVPGQLHVLGVWNPDAIAVAGLGGSNLWPVLFPILMWLASVGIVFVALHVQVVRHLRHLGRQMRRFALGSRTPPEPLPEGVAGELREVQSTFVKMAALVARDEADLSTALREREAALAEKTLLLKEVHHRVKNNLQLIASILNLQMRRLRDPRTRRVLQNVQDRVISLAAIHRSLYQSEQLSELRADHLLDELLRHLFSVGAEASGGVELHTDLEPVTLEADQLVPLSLLMTEAVTNALKYAAPPAGAAHPWMRVSLHRRDGEVVLTLANSVGAPSSGPTDAEGGADTSSCGLGSELISAFATQLGATLDHGTTGGADAARWELRVRFPDAVAAPDATTDTAAAPLPAAAP